MWKYLGESVIGTAHVASGLPCQDAHALAVVEDALIAVVADGAGSASRADLGAQRACASLLASASRAVSERQPLDARAWFETARTHLADLAATEKIDQRDLACTALLAVVTPEVALFAQLGDGAIVATAGDTFRPIFWPEPGEYVNVSDFLTDAAMPEKLLLTTSEPVSELALFTDGLQRLALDYATRLGHPGFFNVLFGPLRLCADAEVLREPLRSLLLSPRINARTDDDKTLILATRTPAHVTPQPE